MYERKFEEVLAENGTLVWKNVGVSMMPLIREGRDLIVIQKRPEGRLKKYDVALFKRPGVVGRGEYVLHRVLKVYPDDTYWIVGDNCIDGEIVREENIIGVLSAVVRDGKKIDGENLRYRLYVHLWCAPYPLRFFLLRHRYVPKSILGKFLRILHGYWK